MKKIKKVLAVLMAMAMSATMVTATATVYAEDTAATAEEPAVEEDEELEVDLGSGFQWKEGMKLVFYYDDEYIFQAYYEDGKFMGGKVNLETGEVENPYELWQSTNDEFEAVRVFLGMNFYGVVLSEHPELLFE